MKITRKQAKLEGKHKYFTGNPCKNMHIAERYVVNGHCVICSGERAKKPEVLMQVAKYRNENKNKLAARYDAWLTLNREKKNSYMKYYNASIKNRRSKKYQSDPLFNLSARARASVAKAISRLGYTKRSSTTALVGCNWEELKEHIERQFTKGMSWENKSKWHIDHIVPVASAKNEEELLSLFHFTNLRPLWASVNQKKSSKLEYLI